MKYILSIIFICIYTITFANSIEVSTNKQHYNIDENITLNIEILSENNNNGEIQITGIENDFHIIGQSQSRQTQIINGVSTTNIFISVTLIAKQAGEYSLGPVLLQYQDNGIIESQKIDITISGERILVNPNLPAQKLPSNSGSVYPPDLSKIQLGNNDKKVFQPVLGIDGEPMNDIYPIKQNILPKIYHIGSIIGAIIATLIYIIFGYIYIKYLKQSVVKSNIIQKPRYNIFLKSIISKHIDDTKEIFYGKIGDLFREYLDNEVKNGLSHKSLSEAKNILPKHLQTLYTSIYYPAYSNTVDDIQSRKKIVHELTKIFANK